MADEPDAAAEEQPGDEAAKPNLGAFIRNQRQLANMSLRQMAQLTDVSNAYLSQVERGLHEPSVRVVRSIAKALGTSTETLLNVAGLLGDDEASELEWAPGRPGASEAAIAADPRLTDEQRDALLSVYRSYAAKDK